MNLKSKYPYCFSVAFYNSKLFRAHAFKVRDDASFIKKAFEEGNESILQWYESFYYQMLTSDRACEKDIMSKYTTTNLDESFIDEGQDIGAISEAIRLNKNKNISKAKKKT